MKKAKKTSENRSIKEQKKKSSKEKKEFIIALCIVIFIVFLLVISKFLPGMIDDLKYKMSLVEFTMGENCIIDDEGNTFYMLSPAVEAINEDTLYGNMEDMEFYRIYFMTNEGETPKYIVENLGEYLGYVYRLESEENITLSNFDSIAADIFLSEAETPHDHFIAHDKYLENGGSSSNDEDMVNLLTESLLNGEPTSAPTVSSSLKIKLKSQKYPGLYYVTMYIEDESGVSYLYDVGSGKYVNCPDELTVRLS